MREIAGRAPAGKGGCERAGQDARGQPLKATQGEVTGAPASLSASRPCRESRAHTNDRIPVPLRHHYGHACFFPFPRSDRENPGPIGEHFQDPKRRKEKPQVTMVFAALGQPKGRAGEGRGSLGSGAPPGYAKSRTVRTCQG